MQIIIYDAYRLHDSIAICRRVVLILNTITFIFYFTEIEAAEACRWLKAAGFPQYAQMYSGKSPHQSLMNSSLSPRQLLKEFIELLRKLYHF